MLGLAEIVGNKFVMKMSRSTIKLVIPIIVVLLSMFLIKAQILTDSSLFVIQLILFISIIFVIWESSDLLVEASQKIAEHYKVSPFLIGLTVIAFGTSVPELGTSLLAGLGGRGDIAIANIVGSNILNISVILGGLAFLTKGGLAINRQSIKLDTPFLIFGTLLVLLFLGQSPIDSQFTSGLEQFGLLDLQLGFFEAIVLLGFFVTYFYIIIKKRDKAHDDFVETDTMSETVTKEKSISFDIFRIVMGLTFVMLGCHVLVGEVSIMDGVRAGYGAVWFASVFEVPDFLVGLSIVALGTSAPEIVVSLSAVKSKSIDIGIGNLLGSAIFNLFAVLGIAGMFVQPPLADAISIQAEAIQSLFAMGILFIMLLVFFITRRRLSRREGLILCSTGLAYMIYEIILTMPYINL